MAFQAWNPARNTCTILSAYDTYALLDKKIAKPTETKFEGN